MKITEEELREIGFGRYTRDHKMMSILPLSLIAAAVFISIGLMYLCEYVGINENWGLLSFLLVVPVIIICPKNMRKSRRFTDSFVEECESDGIEVDRGGPTSRPKGK